MVAVDELDYQAERRALKLLLEKSAWVDMRWRSAHCSISNFLDAYTNWHGEHGVLAFENALGALQWVSHEELAEMCRGLKDKPRVVFLSACFGLTSAQAFVELGIPHVVSVAAERVLDRASLEFTDAFYSALFAGKSVAGAFQLGAARLVAMCPSEKDKFRLLGGAGLPGREHDECLFGPRASPLARPYLLEASAALAPSQCPAPALFSLGRLVAVQEVYALLQHGVKLVCLCGPRGVGKTEVALQVAAYARERHIFSRLLFLDLGRAASCSENACLEKLAVAFNGPCPQAEAEGEEGAVFRCARAGDVEGTVSLLRCREDEACLLVLDGLDDWLAGAGDSASGDRRDFLRRLVLQLRLGLGPAAALLLTCSARLQLDCSSRDVVLEGLSDACAARLFALRAPRPLDSDELHLDAHPQQDPIRAFSKSKLLQSMKGNCRVIELVARELQFDGQPQNLLRYETFFREEIVPNVFHLVQQGGSAAGSWSDVQHRLSAAFRRALGVELCRARPLSDKCFAFLAACPAWGAAAEVPALNGFRVLPDALVRFWTWFDQLLLALKCSRLWGRPHCIFGFTSRQAAAALLANSEVGTFLIGVSQTEGSCLVINVVTAPGRVLPVKVKCNPQSPCPFSYDMAHGMTSSFASLEALLRSNAQLVRFYTASTLDNGDDFIIKSALLP